MLTSTYIMLFYTIANSIPLFNKIYLRKCSNSFITIINLVHTYRNQEAMKAKRSTILLFLQNLLYYFPTICLYSKSDSHNFAHFNLSVCILSLRSC